MNQRIIRKIKEKRPSCKSGFTLIESLVAITILVMAVTGPLTLASKGLTYASYAKDEITAFYLAREAVDAVRNIRDANIKDKAENPTENISWISSTGDTASRDNLVTQCTLLKPCRLDVWNDPPDLRNAFESAGESSNFALVKYCKSGDSLFFGHNFATLNGPTSVSRCDEEGDTIFTRQVFVEDPNCDVSNVSSCEDPQNINEIRVTSKVSWVGRSGISRSVSIVDSFFNQNAEDVVFGSSQNQP